MNESEWTELQRLWKSEPPQPPPVADELARLARRRKWRAAELVVGSAIALAGLAAGIAMILAGGLFLVAGGIATCVFVATVCALSLWASLAAKPRADEAVSHTLAAARRNARDGIRHAAAMIWATVAGMLFTAAMALARGFLTSEAHLGGFVAIGTVQLMLAGWLALAFRHYQARSAALARLDALAAALDQ